jgi:hypothetical protein
MGFTACVPNKERSRQFCGSCKARSFTKRSAFEIIRKSEEGEPKHWKLQACDRSRIGLLLGVFADSASRIFLGGFGSNLNGERSGPIKEQRYAG